MPLARQVSFTLPEQGDQNKLEHLQRLSAAIMGQGALAQPRADMVPGYPGPWVVPPSPLEHLGKLANQAVSLWGERKEKQAQDAKNQALAEALRKSWGAPEQAPPAAAPPGQAPFAQPPGMPVQPAQPQPQPQSQTEPTLGGVPLAVWMGASPDQRQLMAQVAGEREKELERRAYVYAPTGEVDVPATQRNLAAISPKLGMQFQREHQDYQTTMMKRATENEEVQRRIRADEEKRQKAARDNAVKGALQRVFDVIQGGGSEQDAIMQGGQFYNAALQEAQLPAQRFDPSAMGFTEEGEIIPVAAGGGLQPVAGKGPPQPSPGLAPTPQERGDQPLQAPGAGAAPKDYNWQLAYLYTASRLPKYNPQSADFVLDYRTGQPIENAPKTQVAERRARAGASNVTVGDFGKPAQNKLEEGMINAADGIRRLKAVRESFDPSYLTLGTKWRNIVSAGKERLGIELSAEDRENLQDFPKFKRTTLANVNRYIKDITGAAMQEAEAKRIQAALPGMDDSPTEFRAKLNDALDELTAILEAYDAARTGGPGQLTPYQRAPRGTATGAPQGKPINPQPRTGSPSKGADPLGIR